MRTYDIEIVDANDNIVAYWHKLDQDTLMMILSTIVTVKGYFINLRIHFGE